MEMTSDNCIERTHALVKIDVIVIFKTLIHLMASNYSLEG